MPFITEELWHAMGNERAEDLILSSWPLLDVDVDEDARADMNWVISVITAIRAARAEANVPAGAKLPCFVRDAGEDLDTKLGAHEVVLKRLARLDMITVDANADTNAALQVIVDGATYVLPLAGAIDLGAERARLNKAIEKLEKEVKSFEGRLANEAFIAKAPDHVIAENKAKLEAARSEKAKLGDALVRLG